MTLQQLKYIVEISNCGSMREASAKLFVSQPSLSVAVKGVISSDLNGENITAVPLEVEEKIRVGYIMRKDVQLSDMAQRYVQLLEEYIREIL